VRSGLFVGLVTLDVIQRVERVPGPNEKITAISADVAAGGPAANAAVTFAALGGSAMLVTVLGAGPVRVVVADDLSRHHVGVVDAAAPDHSGPAVSAVSVVAGTGDRTVLSRTAEHTDTIVPAELPDLVSSADVVLVDGHLPSLARAAVDAAHRTGVRVVLDGGSWKPAIAADVLPNVDAAVCSAAFTVPGCRDIAESARALLMIGVPFVAFTDGPRAIQWWTEKKSGAVDVPCVTARDTLGAGDVFHGAFAFAIAAGADTMAALGFGAEVAAVRVGHPGPRAWLADPRLAVLAEEISG
jgi:sugar/nucleoside kinase (ribokinase family)